MATSTAHEDWYLVESHEANPLFDLVAQSSIAIHDSTGRDDAEFSVIAINRPSFAQVAALKTGAQNSTHPRPIPSVRRSSSTGPSKKETLKAGRAGNKYGTDYNLKKSGKKYIAVKA